MGQACYMSEYFSLHTKPGGYGYGFVLLEGGGMGMGIPK